MWWLGAYHWLQVNGGRIDDLRPSRVQKLDEQDKDSVLTNILGDFHVMPLVVVVGFCSYKPTFMGLFIDFDCFCNLFCC